MSQAERTFIIPEYPGNPDLLTEIIDQPDIRLETVARKARFLRTTLSTLAENPYLKSDFVDLLWLVYDHVGMMEMIADGAITGAVAEGRV